MVTALTSPTRTINRSVVCLYPLEPFLDWVRGLGGFDGEDEFEDLEASEDAYLVSEKKVDSLVAARRWACRNWKTLFEMKLEGGFKSEAQHPLVQ